MNTRKIYLLFAVAAAVLLGGCKDNTKQPEVISPNQFLRKTNPGLYEGGKSIYAFTKTKDQLYVNASTDTYRIVNNEGTEYVQIVLDAPVTDIGQKVKVSVTSKGMEDIPDYDGVEMEVKKKDSQYCWLWSQDKNLGVLLFYISQSGK